MCSSHLYCPTTNFLHILVFNIWLHRAVSPPSMLQQSRGRWGSNSRSCSKNKSVNETSLRMSIMMTQYQQLKRIHGMVDCDERYCPNQIMKFMTFQTIQQQLQNFLLLHQSGLRYTRENCHNHCHRLNRKQLIILVLSGALKHPLMFPGLIGGKSPPREGSPRSAKI